MVRDAVNVCIFLSVIKSVFSLSVSVCLVYVSVPVCLFYLLVLSVLSIYPFSFFFSYSFSVCLFSTDIHFLSFFIYPFSISSFFIYPFSVCLFYVSVSGSVFSKSGPPFFCEEKKISPNLACYGDERILRLGVA